MVLFVSCYINLNEDRPLDKRVDAHFANAHKLIDTGVPVALFVSPCYSSYVNKHFAGATNLTVYPIDFNDIELVKACAGLSVSLPTVRNEKHDTRNFLLLMNAKIEFLARAILLSEGKHSHAAWIDFGIAHVFKDPWNSSLRIRQIHDSTLQDRLLVFPGSWNKGERVDQLWSRVNWRFSGGFFLGDTQSLLEMFEMTRQYFIRSITDSGILTWETNFWCLGEQQGWFSPTWYHGDHNDSILDIPAEFFKRQAPLADVTRGWPHDTRAYWDGPFSRSHAKKDIELYTALAIHQRGLPLTAVFSATDGVLSTKEFLKMKAIKDLKGVNNISEAQYAENEAVAKIGTYPTMATLCSRSFKRPNMFYTPLDDEIFTKGLGAILGDGLPLPAWENRKPIAVWRGGTSGYERPSIRVRTVQALLDSSVADVRLTRGGWAENMKGIPDAFFGDAIPPSQQMGHKYIFIIDGNCIASNHMWVFGSGSVPIMITHPENNFWFKKYLKPMENYVPVKYDLSDLREKLDWLVANDAAARKISEAAKALADEIFSPSFQRRYIDEELARIAAAQYNRVGFDTILWRKIQTPGDIHEHLAVLREYAGRCESIVECGVLNSVSSYAFATALLGKPNNRYYLVDPYRNSGMDTFLEACSREGINARFHHGSDLECPREEADLVFIDTWHIYAQLKRELEYWGPYAKKYLILHDTTVDEWEGESIRGRFDIQKQARETGWPAEEIAKGLWPAVEEYLEAHPEWVLERRFVNNNGLTILRRI
jgi:hypothetical protein